VDRIRKYTFELIFFLLIIFFPTYLQQLTSSMWNNFKAVWDGSKLIEERPYKKGGKS
jgi:hypothetical protein